MNQQELFVRMAFNAWNNYIKKTDQLLESLSDEQLLKQVAPGRNRGVYLVGHLVSVHDHVFEILGVGERMYTSFDGPFHDNPDSEAVDRFSVDDLRRAWKITNQRFSEACKALKAEEWFMRHTLMSDEDHSREPHRNRLSVLITRTDHLAYHLGQLAFLK